MGNAPFKITFAIFILAIAFAVGFMKNGQENRELKKLRVGSGLLVVEVADTLLKQRQGLSNRDSLGTDKGMLFVYDDIQVRNFWMKDMKFPLDVIWIADGKVVSWQENIPFAKEGAGEVRFSSVVGAEAALEVNAGWIASNPIKIGDLVDFVGE